jgi:DedD protein
MSFFNFRRGGSSAAPPAAAAAQTDSVEVMRKRAKHRLMGAAVLVLLGVLGFPLLFDTQPRPISVDIPIEIPEKNTVKPLAPPARVPAAATAPVKVIAPNEKVAADASLAPEEEILPATAVPGPAEPAPAVIKNDVKPSPKVESKVEPKTELKAQVQEEVKPSPKTPPPDGDGARARALLNATPLPAKAAVAETEGRMVVQVGAFADAVKAREVRSKLEGAGLKTYTQVTDTIEGKRTRVRVGPFSSRADAEKAAAKIKKLDFPAVILSL